MDVPKHDVVRLEIFPDKAADIKKEIRDLTHFGVRAREDGHYQQAFKAFGIILEHANAYRLWPDVVNAYCQRLLVFYHRYQNQGEREDLEKWGQDAIAAYSIAEQHGLNGQPRALAFLRLGQFYSETDNAKLGVNMMRESLNYLTLLAPEYAEHLSHLALALARYSIVADGGLAELAIRESLTKIEAAKFRADNQAGKVTKAQKQIVLCGVLMHWAQIFNIMGKRKECLNKLKEAKQTAEGLTKRHYAHRQRLKQVTQLAKEFGFSEGEL